MSENIEFLDSDVPDFSDDEAALLLVTPAQHTRDVARDFAPVPRSSALTAFNCHAGLTPLCGGLQHTLQSASLRPGAVVGHTGGGLAGQPGVDGRLGSRLAMQPEFAAAPEDILAAPRPFVARQIIHLARI